MSDFPANPRDQRAHPRYPIQLPALVAVAGGAVHPGTIRDFCRGGVFLSLPESSWTGLDRIRPLERGLALRLEILLEESSGRRRFQLNALVVRMATTGLGLSFVNPDPAMLAALERLASRPSPPGTLGSAGAGAAPRAARELLGRLRDTAEGRLSGLLFPFFLKVENELVTAAGSAESNLEQSHYFDAVASLRRNREALRGGFIERVREHLDALLSAPAEAPAPHRDASGGELSLLEKDEFEEMLAVSEVAARAEAQLREPLYGLNRRLGVLLGRVVEDAANPVGPAVVVRSFQEAARPYGLHHRAMKVLFRVFEGAVLPELEALYDALNELLERQGVALPPEPPPRIVGHPGGERGRRPAPAEPEVPAPAATGPARHETAPKVPSVPGAPMSGPPAAAGGWETTVEADALEADSMPGEAVPVRAGPAPVVPPTEAPAGSVARGFGAARALLDLSRSAAQPRSFGRGAAGAPAAPPEPYELVPRDELLEALDQLQAHDRLAPEDAADAAPVKQRLLEALARDGSEGLKRRLRQGDSDMIDLVGQLLDSLFEDRIVHAAVKARVQKLRTPIHKAALLDEQFFHEPSHPARRFLEELTRLDPEADPSGALWERVDPLVDEVAAEYGRDVEVFARNLGPLRQVVEGQRHQYAANVGRVIRACEDQQSVLRARRKAQPGAGASAPAVPPELAEWVARARRLHIGDQLALRRGSGPPKPVRLAWVGEDQGSFVFVDPRGEKAATLSLQEVAMELRRGGRPVAAAADAPPVERSMLQLLSRMHDRLEEQATHDPVTGLINRRRFEVLLAEAIKQAVQEHRTHVLGFLDLDQFRMVADGHGEEAVTAYLREVGILLRSAVPEGAVLASLENDRFGLLLEDATPELAGEVAERLRGIVEDLHLPWQGETLHLTLSVGLAVVDGSTADAQGLMKAAESACRAAKDAGRNRVKLFVPDDRQIQHRRSLADWASHINRTLKEDRLQLRCQLVSPIGVDPSVRPHYEILLGVRDEQGQPLAPAEFMAAAEYYQQMPAVDRWVLRQALRWMAGNSAELRKLGGMAVNLSGPTLSDEGLTAFVIEQLNETRVPPGKLMFEVTESVAIASLSVAQQFITTMSDFGCRFALDDFGSGHASYAYLKTLPVGFVKIDGQFVQGIADSPSDYAVVKSINEIAHFMGKKTIAEYVDRPEILDALRAMGVDYAQGYLLGRPRYLNASGMDPEPAPGSPAPAPRPTGTAAAPPDDEPDFSETTLRL